MYGLYANVTKSDVGRDHLFPTCMGYIFHGNFTIKKL